MGGGKTLYEISLAKPKTDGEEVVYYACRQPIIKIIENAGFDAAEILKDIKEGEVWNSSTFKKTTTPIQDGLVDPAKVERCALQNAESLGSMFITTCANISEIPQKP